MSPAPLPRTRCIDLFARAVALVMERPYTSLELAIALECHPKATRSHMRALHAAGVVYITAWSTPQTGHSAPVWAWQTTIPSVDASRRSRVHRASRAPTPRREVPATPRVRSVFELSGASA